MSCCMRREAQEAAWKFVKGVFDSSPPNIDFKKFASVAKAAPSLFMQSGLFQSLAYLNQKSDPEHKKLCAGLVNYLLGDHKTFEDIQRRLREGPCDLMGLSDRALEWLEGVKLFASALEG